MAARRPQRGQVPRALRRWPVLRGRVQPPLLLRGQGQGLPPRGQAWQPLRVHLQPLWQPLRPAAPRTLPVLRPAAVRRASFGCPQVPATAAKRQLRGLRLRQPFRPRCNVQDGFRHQHQAHREPARLPRSAQASAIRRRAASCRSNRFSPAVGSNGHSAHRTSQNR